MRVLLYLAASTLALSLAQPALAQSVNETAGANGSQATAQDLSGTFGLTASPDIQNSTMTPHVTVISGENAENEYDYYSFTVALAGTAGIFDIDYGFFGFSEESSSGFESFSHSFSPGFDSFLSLLDSSGNILAQNDDAGTSLGAGGSVHQYDAFINYNFANAGTYAIRVGTCCESPANGSYQLQVSLEAPGVTGAVPEPATWAMMLIGFGAIGVSLRRRRKMTATHKLA